jgi:hypothetical protein
MAVTFMRHVWVRLLETNQWKWTELLTRLSSVSAVYSYMERKVQVGVVFCRSFAVWLYFLLHKYISEKTWNRKRRSIPLRITTSWQQKISTKHIFYLKIINSAKRICCCLIHIMRRQNSSDLPWHILRFRPSRRLSRSKQWVRCSVQGPWDEKRLA